MPKRTCSCVFCSNPVPYLNEEKTKDKKKTFEGARTPAYIRSDFGGGVGILKRGKRTRFEIKYKETTWTVPDLTFHLLETEREERRLQRKNDSDLLVTKLNLLSHWRVNVEKCGFVPVTDLKKWSRGDMKLREYGSMKCKSPVLPLTLPAVLKKGLFSSNVLSSDEEEEEEENSEKEEEEEWSFEEASESWTTKRVERFLSREWRDLVLARLLSFQQGSGKRLVFSFCHPCTRQVVEVKLLPSLMLGIPVYRKRLLEGEETLFSILPLDKEGS